MTEKTERESNIFTEVDRELAGTIARVSLDPQLIDTKVSELEARLGMDVYSQLLYLLCHLDFPSKEAKSHWTSILEHRNRLAEKLGQSIDFRVALLDYFISVNRHFENPKIIEIRIFQKTQDSAIRDELTGLYNYRYFHAELEHEIRRSLRVGKPLTLALFDIDHFKWYNDQNGHLAGDKVLQIVGRILQEEVRDSDLVVRFGGEEFAILFTEINKPQAFRVADRIRRKISEYPFPFRKAQPSGRVSISGGIATYRVDASNPLELIEAADNALYRAKGNGRDRILTVGHECRSYSRVETSIPGKLQCMSQKQYTFSTSNLSEQGFQFRCQVSLQEGDYFLFTLALPDGTEEIEGVARVLRTKRVVRIENRGEKDCYEIGAEIVEISYRNSRVLREYLEKRSVPAVEPAGARDESDLE